MAPPLLTSSELLLRDSKEYSIYVAQNRYPLSYRWVKTWTENGSLGLATRADKIKTNALAGLINYLRLYIHGDQALNDSIGKLAAPYLNNVPLIEGLGDFGGRVNPGGIGAPRYTEVQRSKPAQAFLYNDLDLVPQIDNYDGSNKQPLHFLPLIPLVLLNGVSGIAVGWSTDILPRSLKSIIQATQDALAGRPIKGLDPYFEKYDVDIASIGENQWEFSGRLKIIDASTINIYELPPGEKISSFRAKLIQLEDAGEINGFTDRSTSKIDITVKFKRGALAAQPARVDIEDIDGKKVRVKIPAKSAWTVADAIKFFKLRERTTERIVVIDWNCSRIKQYAKAEDLVVDFVKWRLACYTTRYQHFLDAAKYEKNYYLVLDALFKDNFPNRLGPKFFADRNAIEIDVTSVAAKSKLTIDEKQLDRIVNLPTYRWTKAFATEITSKINELNVNIKEYTDIIGSPVRLKGIYNDEIEELKKLK